MVRVFRVNIDRVKVAPVPKFVINRIVKDRFDAQMLEPHYRNAQVYSSNEIMNKDNTTNRDMIFFILISFI